MEVEKRMLKQKESLVSAYHNYLVNNMLSPGFFAGDPHSATEFYFLADIMLPGELTPAISARFYDKRGTLVLEMKRNRMTENPRDCVFENTPGGFRVMRAPDKLMLQVNIQKFANGYLTSIKGKLYDSNRVLRMEPSYEGIQVYGDACLALDAPFVLKGER